MPHADAGEKALVELAAVLHRDDGAMDRAEKAGPVAATDTLARGANRLVAGAMLQDQLISTKNHTVLVQAGRRQVAHDPHWVSLVNTRPGKSANMCMCLK